MNYIIVCSVCKEDLTSTTPYDDPIAKRCGHLFHRACLNTTFAPLDQLEKFCPICKKAMPGETNVKLNFASQMDYVRAKKARQLRGAPEPEPEPPQEVPPPQGDQDDGYGEPWAKVPRIARDMMTIDE